MRVLLPEGLPWPPTGPGLWKTEGSSTLRRGLRGSILPSENRGATVIRAHKAQLRRAERETAWLPALLVWTWVRAHRQLHAGNAGLRPATTNFPYGSACVTVVSAGCSARSREAAPTSVFRSTPAGAMGLRTRRNAPCSNSSCQSKMAKTALSIARQRSRD